MRPAPASFRSLGPVTGVCGEAGPGSILWDGGSCRDSFSRFGRVVSHKEDQQERFPVAASFPTFLPFPLSGVPKPENPRTISAATAAAGRIYPSSSLSIKLSRFTVYRRTKRDWLPTPLLDTGNSRLPLVIARKRNRISKIPNERPPKMKL